MAELMQEFRAFDVDIHLMVGGAVLTAMTDKGQIAIYLTTPAFELLAHRTKRELSHEGSSPVHQSDKPQN
jgi:hypothetical protein